MDFQLGLDKIVFEGFNGMLSTWSQIASHITNDASGNAVITFGSSSITLVGISASQLSIANFGIAP